MNYPLSRTLSLFCLLSTATAALAAAQTAAVPNAPGAGGGDAAASSGPVGPAKIAVIEFQPAVAQTNEGQRDFAEIRKKYEPKQAQIKQM
jgi:outer membrane protein